MIYRQKNKKNKFKFIFLLIGLLIILRLFDNPIAIRIFNYPVHFILDSQNKITEPIKNKLIYFRDKEELKARIAQLEKENLDLKINQIFNQSNMQEFQYFVNNFGTTQEIDKMFRVISQPPFASFDFIKITGDLSQYQVGDFVFYKSILIGEIIEKNNSYASVKLFSTPEYRIPALLNGTQFEAFGLGSGRYFFEVANDFEVKEGDIIVYPHQNPYILGSVGLVETSPEVLFKKVYFNIPISLNSISYVSILSKNTYEQ